MPSIPAGYELLSGPITRDLVLQAFETADERGYPEESVLTVSEGLLIPTGEDVPGIASQPDYEAIAARNSESAEVSDVVTTGVASGDEGVTEENTAAEIDAWADAHGIKVHGTKAEKIQQIADAQSGKTNTED